MMEMFGRSWRFLKISLYILSENKRLVVFPIISGLMGYLVLISFLVPMYQSGALAELSMVDESAMSLEYKILTYAGTFVLYFCDFFIIVFFNTALIACVMEALSGGRATLMFGLRAAADRLPQIIGWALMSASVGVLLLIIQRLNRRLGRFVASMMGAAWTILTFFAIPVIVNEGVGPRAALKRSVEIMRSVWGDGLLSRFSLMFVGFLLMLPVFILSIVLTFAGLFSGSLAVMLAFFAIAVVMFTMAAAATTTADAIFKAVLFNYATSTSLPVNIDTTEFAKAFHVNKADI